MTNQRHQQIGAACRAAHGNVPIRHAETEGAQLLVVVPGSKPHLSPGPVHVGECALPLCGRQVFLELLEVQALSPNNQVVLNQLLHDVGLQLFRGEGRDRVCPLFLFGWLIIVSLILGRTVGRLGLAFGRCLWGAFGLALPLAFGALLAFAFAALLALGSVPAGAASGSGSAGSAFSLALGGASRNFLLGRMSTSEPAGFLPLGFWLGATSGSLASSCFWPSSAFTAFSGFG